MDLLLRHSDIPHLADCIVQLTTVLDGSCDAGQEKIPVSDTKAVAKRPRALQPTDTNVVPIGSRKQHTVSHVIYDAENVQ